MPDARYCDAHSGVVTRIDGLALEVERQRSALADHCNGQGRHVERREWDDMDKRVTRLEGIIWKLAIAVLAAAAGGGTAAAGIMKLFGG